MNRKVIALMLAMYTACALTPVAWAQSEAQMDQLLNVVDRPGAWAHTPVSGVQAQPMPSGTNPAMMSQGGGMMNSAMMNQGMMNQGMVNQGMVNQPGMMRPNMLNNMMSGGVQQRQGLFNGSPARPMNQNPFTPQNLLKTFLGGSPNTGSGGSGGTVDDSAAVGNAQSQLQIARDQAAQAEGDAGRASYGERSSRKSAAYSAQCHADAARAAADRATSIAGGHSLAANDAAAQARNAANRAQAAADRASYNANTGN